MLTACLPVACRSYLPRPCLTTSPPPPAPLYPAALYEALGPSLTSERSVLLLYALLQGCPHFQAYCLVCTAAAPLYCSPRTALHCTAPH